MSDTESSAIHITRSQSNLDPELQLAIERSQKTQSWIMRTMKLCGLILVAILLGVIVIVTLSYYENLKLRSDNRTLTESLSTASKLAEDRRILLSVKEAELDSLIYQYESSNKKNISNSIKLLNRDYIQQYSEEGEIKSGEKIKSEVCDLLQSQSLICPK